MQGSLDSARELREFGRDRGRRRRGCGNVEGAERGFAVDASMVIYVALCQSGAEPAKKRAST